MKSMRPFLSVELYQLKISLRDIKPLIWHRVIVPSSFTLARLHDVFQICMGWQNVHLYQFEFGKLRFGVPDEEFPDHILNARGVKLSDIVDHLPRKITYVYDFGDWWEHEVKIEKIIAAEKGKRYPLCVEGARACPPEDCGGIPGYEDVLQALASPKKKESRDILEWVGAYDPEAYSVEKVNERLRIAKRVSTTNDR